MVMAVTVRMISVLSIENVPLSRPPAANASDSHPARKNETINAAMEIIRDSQVSDALRLAVEAPATLRVLMSRMRTGARDVKKLAKFSTPERRTSMAIAVRSIVALRFPL